MSNTASEVTRQNEMYESASESLRKLWSPTCSLASPLASLYVGLAFVFCSIRPCAKIHGRPKHSHHGTTPKYFNSLIRQQAADALKQPHRPRKTTPRMPHTRCNASVAVKGAVADELAQQRRGGHPGGGGGVEEGEELEERARLGVLRIVRRHAAQQRLDERLRAPHRAIEDTHAAATQKASVKHRKT